MTTMYVLCCNDRAYASFNNEALAQEIAKDLTKFKEFWYVTPVPTIQTNQDAFLFRNANKGS